MKIESVKRGDLFRSQSGEYSLVCAVEPLTYSLIDLASSNRWTEPLKYDDLIEYINEKGFKYIPNAKISVNDCINNPILVECKVEMNQEQIKEIERRFIEHVENNIKLSIGW